MAILNTHCEHNVAVTVAGELSPVIRFLSHTAALPFLKKKSLAFMLDLYLYFPDIPHIFDTTFQEAGYGVMEDAQHNTDAVYPLFCG
jgi:hypothetical protein